MKIKIYASTSLGSEAINEIEILTDINEIENLLVETDEALKLLFRIGEAPWRL